jgi:hypothetical protein
MQILSVNLFPDSHRLNLFQSENPIGKFDRIVLNPVRFPLPTGVFPAFSTGKPAGDRGNALEEILFFNRRCP